MDFTGVLIIKLNNERIFIWKLYNRSQIGNFEGLCSIVYIILIFSRSYFIKTEFMIMKTEKKSIFSNKERDRWIRVCLSPDYYAAIKVMISL